MTAEAAVSSKPAKRRRHSSGPLFGRSRQEAETPAPSDIQHVMYQSLLRVDEKITKPAQKYSIGEIVLGAANTFDTHEFDGQKIQLLSEVNELEWDVPYIALGTIDFTDEQEAILHTKTMDLYLGTIDPHIHRLLETAMKGHELAVPIVFDEVDGETQILTGDQVAYLIPNPDWVTRYRLGQIEGAGLVKGEVKELDPHDRRRMRVEVSPGRGLMRGKKITVQTDAVPRYDQGTEERPTNGEEVQEGDRLLVPVVFSGRKARLNGKPSLITFSTDHMLSYEQQRQTLETHLHNFGIVVSNSEVQSIDRPNGDVWDISEPHAREAVARYLYAEIMQMENILTSTQREKVQNTILLMDESARPMIFAPNDPMHRALDQYFRMTDQDNQFPRLAAAMTPPQLVSEMIYMTAFGDASLPLEDLMRTISRYPEQFGQINPLEFIHSALISREEQLRTGTNPDAAINTLLDVLPYLKDQDVRYSSEWFAHIIHAGMGLAEQQLEWSKSTELEYLMSQSIYGLAGMIYPAGELLRVNHDALFAIFPYVQFIRQWPDHLPFRLGEYQGLTHILRDLEIISLSRGEEGTYSLDPRAEQLDVAASGLHAV